MEVAPPPPGFAIDDPGAVTVAGPRPQPQAAEDPGWFHNYVIDPVVGAVKSFAGGIAGIAAAGAGGTDPETERAMNMAQAVSKSNVPIRPTAQEQKNAVARGMTVFEPKTVGQKVGYYTETGIELAFIPLSLFKAVKGVTAARAAMKAADEIIAQAAAKGVELSAEQINAVRTGEKLKLTAQQVAKMTAAKSAEEATAPALRVASDTTKAPTAAKVARATALGEKVAASTGERELGKYAGDAAGQHTGVNLDRLNVGDETKQFIDDVATERQRKVGEPVTFQDVKDAATDAKPITKPVSREAMLNEEARVQATRENFAALSNEKGVTPEYLDSFDVVDSLAAERGRALGALRINADPIKATGKYAIVKRMRDAGRSGEEIAKAFTDVDWNDSRAVIDAYREVMKPRNAKEWGKYLMEVLDEWRYGNMLSSPKTHIINVTSTATSVAAKPVVYTVSGLIDPIASALSGAERTNYVSQGPAYVRGAISSLGDGLSAAWRTIKGTQEITHADLGKFIPTNSRITAAHRFVSRVLEANDVMWREIAKGGEMEALLTAAKKGGAVSDVKKAGLAKDAAERAAESIFRANYEPGLASKQGYVLGAMDDVTSKIIAPMQTHWATKWFVPFVRTPYNIAKMGLEYGPGGILTIAGHARKSEQAAKALLGSTVMMGAGIMAMNGDTTWAAPKDKKARDAFYASGRQPYSVRVGDKWVNFSKLGQFGFPMALAAAAKHYGMDDPETAGKGNMEKFGKILASQVEFFGDQSYVQALGNMIDAVREGGSSQGVESAIASVGRQMVPMASLLAWTNQMLDPVYRKAETVGERMRKGIPGMSEDITPYKDSKGRPVARPLPELNAVSPLTISPVNETEEKRYRFRMDAARKRAIYKEKKEEFQKRNGLKARP